MTARFEHFAEKKQNNALWKSGTLLRRATAISFLYSLTLKAPITTATTAADDSLEYLLLFFSDKIMLDISCESSAWQRIHMKHHALFSSKDKRKNNKSVVCCDLLGALRFKNGIPLLKKRKKPTKSIFFPLIVNSLLRRFRGPGTQTKVKTVGSL